MPNLTISNSVLLTDLGWGVNRYRHSTPGIYVCLHVPVILDSGVQYVPGLVAMVNHGRLKQCEPTAAGFEGPPNFVLDVFDSSASQEYEERRLAFEKAGVTEYVVVISDTSTCYWNRHNGTEYERVAPDAQGTLKSKALPGLWFSTTYNTTCKGDSEPWTLVAQIEEGTSRIGHHEFMETIFHKDGRDPAWGDWMPFDAG